MAPDMATIAANIKSELHETPYRCTSLDPLSGGNANFVFRGNLDPEVGWFPFEEVLIKHGEPFVRSDTSFSLPTSRCKVEATILATLGEELAPTTHSTRDGKTTFTVRVPKIYEFNEQTNTQIQEYMPEGIDLKTYCLKYYEPGTSPSKRPQCIALGQALGSWLRNFHDWTGNPRPNVQAIAGRRRLHETARSNKALQLLKNSSYYKVLADQMIDKFPQILEPIRPLLKKLEEVADLEMEMGARQVVHGDFWTGNVLLPDRAIPADEPGKAPSAQAAFNVPMFVVDWEVTSFGMPERDVGQMLAELYMLNKFRDIKAGDWIIEGFMKGYGKLAEERDAFRTLMHIGAHLIVIGGTVEGWALKGKERDVELMVKSGADMILSSWNSDRYACQQFYSLFDPLFDVKEKKDLLALHRTS
ncbi:Protein kinase-like domain containing protein [Naviculisporaceae sp. PSN 640]